MNLIIHTQTLEPKVEEDSRKKLSSDLQVRVVTHACPNSLSVSLTIITMISVIILNQKRNGGGGGGRIRYKSYQTNSHFILKCFHKMYNWGNSTAYFF